MEFKTEWHDRMASTNACMRDRFLNGGTLPDRYVIAAREQTAGRGRQDRKWISQPDTNLYFSLFISTDAPPIEVPSLTMAAALAISEYLNAHKIKASPKWPNDVLVGRKKICGILSERVEHAENKVSGIIVGVGLNVNMSTDEAAEIDRPATSMLIESDKAYDLSQTLESLFQPLAYWISQWEAGGFSSLSSRWMELAGPVGKPLTVHDGKTRKSGTLVDFGNHGELLLQTADGIETIWSGDVS